MEPLHQPQTTTIKLINAAKVQIEYVDELINF